MLGVLVVVALALLPIWRPSRDDRMAQAVRHTLLAAVALISIVTVIGPRSEPPRAGPLLGVPFTRPEAAYPAATPIPDPEPPSAAMARHYRFSGYELRVNPESYRLVLIDDATGLEVAFWPVTFGGPSRGRVERLVTGDGLLHWRLTSGRYEGWSYVEDRALAPFTVFALYEDQNGDRRELPIGVRPIWVRATPR
jgi:hypothetical protein